MKRVLIIVIGLLAPSVGWSAAGGYTFPNDEIEIDWDDKAAMQRGARVFVNYCLSCHSAAYSRFNRIGEDLGIPEDLVEENLIFTTDVNGQKTKIGELMKTTMTPEYAEEAFGVVPPDLTLITRSRGVDWVYNYLRGFYVDDSVPPEMLEMSLARIRQLSAHEVGHTLGFEHNFAASTQDRASVMDYPFPLVRIGEDGELDLSDAYDVGIGAWDKRTVLYAYADFADGVDRAAARREIMDETLAQGFKYVGDSDSRSAGTSHPDGNLWDNGADAVAELDHIMRVRSIALQRFSERNIRIGRPLASIEETLVPVYLLHRFQIQAVGKLIGGQYFTYRMRGDAQESARPVAVARQQQAIDALLGTLDPGVLRLPQGLVDTITPRVPNDPKSRETFSGMTGMNFDALAPARSAVALTLQVLLDRGRAARLERAGAIGFESVVQGLLNASWYAEPLQGVEAAIQRQTNMQVLYGLLDLAFDTSADVDVRAKTYAAVTELQDWLSRRGPGDSALRAQYRFAEHEIQRLMENPDAIKALTPTVVPPGSPIG